MLGRKWVGLEWSWLGLDWGLADAELVESGARRREQNWEKVEGMSGENRLRRMGTKTGKKRRDKRLIKAKVYK